MLLGGYRDRIEELLARARTGWGLSGIPDHLAERTSAHSAKVAIAMKLSLGSDQVKSIISDPRSSVLRAGIHDLCEWDTPDELPPDVEAHVAAKTRIVPTENRIARETASLQRYAARFSDGFPLRSFVHSCEYPDDAENRLIHEHDKLDAGVMALNYRELGYDVEQFIPYARGKISEPLLVGAFEWLLNREYPTLDYFYSYCAYLWFAGDVSRTREHLAERRDAVASAQS